VLNDVGVLFQSTKNPRSYIVPTVGSVRIIIISLLLNQLETEEVKYNTNFSGVLNFDISIKLRTLQSLQHVKRE
jgi:hypothetical protein